MAPATTCLLAVFLMGGVLAASASGSHPWEWAATFDLPAGHYTWSFTKKESGYADPAIQILVMKTTGTSNSSLEAVEAAAETAWATHAPRSSYQELEVGTSYTLQLDEETWTTHFILHVDVGGGHAVFLQHFPYEFENGFHFLQTERGEDVEPVHEDAGDGHDHGHGEHEEPEATECPWSKDWEWAGIFAVAPGWHDWNAEKGAGGSYPDAKMKIAVFTTSEASFSALQGQVQAKWDESSSNDELSAGGTIPLNRAITLKFNQETWASHFKIEVPANSGGHIAVFAQHFPIEFEKNYHYLKDASGADIEPEFEQSGSDCATTAAPPPATSSDRWGEVILASILTVLPTLLGLICMAAALAPAIAKMAEEGSSWLAAVNSFASGVIFAAAVFLLLPEGLYLVSVGKTEAGGAGAWGTAVMCGWLGGVICKHAGQLYAGSGSAKGEADEAGRVQVQVIGAQGEDAVKDVAKDATKGAAKLVDWTVAVPVLFGDMFHNLADGLVMGTAFKTCTASFAWKLTAVTVLHEAPQEVSDFAVLVTRGNLHWGKAAIFNFLSGLSTVLGAIITYSADVSYGVEGVIMAAGGGVYLYVAVTELGPSVTELFKGESYAGAFMRLLCFAVGAIMLGLILLDHEHCGGEHLLSAGSDAAGAPAEEEAGGHGHAHR